MPQLIGNSLSLVSLRYPGAGGGEGAYTANAVNFDGTNDYLTRGADLTSTSSGKELIISLWFRLNGDNDGELYCISNAGATVAVFRQGSGGGSTLAFRFDQTSGVVWNGDSTATFSTSNSEWVHVLIGLNSAVGGNHVLFINDVQETITSETFNSDTTIDMVETDWSVGARTDAGSKMTGDMADVYFSQEFLDFTVESNRRLFISAAGKPVDLGSDGSTPTGNIPIVFFSGPTVDWHTNLGSGGGYTENGALTDSADSPSD